jgi:hypothetical protein
MPFLWICSSQYLQIYCNIFIYLYVYIYLYLDIGKIPIISRFNECFSLRDVGSTSLTVMVARKPFLNYLCSFRLHSSSCFRAGMFFLWEGKYFCLAMCHCIKLVWFVLLTEVINVRLESRLLCPRFGHHYMIGLCDRCSHLLTQFGIKWLFLLFYVKCMCDECKRFNFDWKKTIIQNSSRH